MVLYNISPSDWVNTQYSVEESGAITTTTNSDVLSCQIPVSKLEEGTTILFPAASANYAVSVLGITETDTGTWIAENVNVETTADTVILPEDFTQEYISIALMVQNMTSGSPVSMQYVSGIVVTITDMYFRKSDLMVWVSRQNMMQFESMYPQIVEQSYQMAIANVYAQIGNTYNLDYLLSITDESQKDPTLLWILKVYTAYAMCSPPMNISEPLRANFEQVATAIRELKGGQVSMIDSSSKMQEGGTTNYIVSLKNKYRG